MNLKNQKLAPKKQLARTKPSKKRKQRRPSRRLKLKMNARSVKPTQLLEVMVLMEVALTLTRELSSSVRDVRPRIRNVLKNLMKSAVSNSNLKENNS